MEALAGGQGGAIRGFTKEVSFKGRVGKEREGGIRTCQTHVVLKDKSWRQYIWFENKCRKSHLATMKFEFQVLLQEMKLKKSAL